MWNNDPGIHFVSTFMRVRMIGGTIMLSGVDLGATWGHESDGDCFIPNCNGRFCPGLVSLECD